MTNSTDEIEQEARAEKLDELLDDYRRKPTIQDVGHFLIEYPAYRLPPRLANVLSDWLERTSDYTIKQSHPGRPKTELSDYFPLIDAMRVTEMSVYAICHKIVEKLELHDVDPNSLQKKYGEHRTKLSRLIDDISFGPARIGLRRPLDYTALEKAVDPLGLGPLDLSLERKISKLADKFGIEELKRAIDKEQSRNNCPPA